MALITIDYDNTLSTKRIQNLVKQIWNTNDIFVLTSRLDCLKLKEYNLNSNDDLYATCEEVGIPERNVIFTNQVKKLYWIQNSKVDIHIDDDDSEIRIINSLSNTKCFDAKLEKTPDDVLEYLELIKNF